MIVVDFVGTIVGSFVVIMAIGTMVVLGLERVDRLRGTR